MLLALRALALRALALVVAATSDSTLATAAASLTSARSLPLLAANHTLLGTFYIGDTLAYPNATSRAAADALYARVLSAGAALAQIEISWSDLEPRAGALDVSPLAALLAAARARGAVPLVTVNAIDTNAVKVPADLGDAADATVLAPGLRWSDATVTDRFARVMALAAPLAAYYGAFYVGVGNEIDGNLGLHPETGMDYVSFVVAARAAAHAAATPALAVGATITLPGLVRLSRAPTPPPWVAAILSAADATPLNYYPLNDDTLAVFPLAQIPIDIAAGIALLPPDAPVIFQEVGCPSGFNNATSVDGSSLAYEAAFIDAAAAAFRASGRVRAASFFKLQDWNDSLCLAVATYYVDPPPVALLEYLCTLGVADAAGNAKPAFGRVLAAAAAARI